MKNNYLKVLSIALLIASIIIVPSIINGRGILSIYSDFNHQQIPFTMAANDAIKEGNISYSWINDLGTSFIGTYSFYNLGSIFFIVSLIFPAKLFPYLVGPLLIIKIVIAALLAYIYLERYVKNKNYAIIGALLYTFSGFQITNFLFHFQDVIALFPLLLIGLDKTMLDNKKGLFAIAVAINLFTNYFFFIGQVVFLIIYFLVKIIAKEYKLSVKKFFTLSFESIIGVGIAAFIFIPSIIFVLGNPRIDGSWTIANALLPRTYQLVEILRGMLLAPDIMSERSLFVPYLFTSSELYLPFVGGILFISYIYKKSKNWISILIFTCFIFMIIPILNSTFFALTTSYYARWFYMAILIMSLASAKALEENIKLENGYLIMALLFSIFIFLTLLYSLNNKQVVYHFSYFLINILISLFGYIGLYLAYKFKNNKKVFNNLILIGVIISSSMSGLVFFYKYNKLLPPIEYNETYLNNGLKLKYLQDGERTDSNDSVNSNLGYILGIPNLKNFNTSISQGSFTFYKSLGIERTVRTDIGENHPKLRDFLSTKYFITKSAESMELKLVEKTKNYNVYENENYVSMGIPYNYYISKQSFDKLEQKTKEDILIYAVVLDEKQIDRYKDILKKLDLEKIEKLNTNYKKYIKSLENKTSTNFHYTSNGAELDITTKKDTLIVMSIPYDKGWTITINGEKKTYENVDNGLIGIKIGKGKNKIKLEYTTPGLKIGTIISILSLTSLGIYLIITRKRLNYKI